MSDNEMGYISAELRYRPFHQFIKVLLERFVYTSQTRNHRYTPFDVLASAFDRPIGGRTIGNVVDVADLVGEFNGLCPGGEMR